MFSRRAFGKRLAAIVVAVALAPEIAFRQKLALPESIGDFWLETRCIQRVQSEAYLEWRKTVLVDRAYDTPYLA